MEAALDRLRGAGLRLAVVTSKRHALAWRGLEVFDLTHYFEFLVGADDCETHKPDPAPLLLAAGRMGLESRQCAYLGDSPYDMQAARAAGMLALGALWGMFSGERLLEAGAQSLLTSPSELDAKRLAALFSHPKIM
jgi:pyrophosphatase PpaX